MAKNLYQRLANLRFRGIGTVVVRGETHYRKSVWFITRVDSEKTYQKIFGRLIKDGKVQNEEVRVRSVLKDQWKILSFPDYKTFFPSQELISKEVGVIEARPLQ